ncbi:MAG: RNA polymerase sigma factor [Fimbriimonadaceae bacterium]|nr:RNA polymerase sigma factor [Fimbriimonadaceae bacterium]QYK56945.1 MAG: RNA polymerase sigma factor [Fimbriimonadaceae bacterium]
MEQYALGDRHSGERLAEHFRAVLRRRFSALGLNSNDVEDLVQDCVTLIFDALGDFDQSKGSLDAWLSGFARNVARSWWRGVYARRESETAFDVVPEMASPDGVDLAGSGALETALSSLSPIDVELLQMRFGFGYSFDEIAHMSGLTPVNARKRVSRAVEALRQNQGLRQEFGFAV